MTIRKLVWANIDQGNEACMRMSLKAAQKKIICYEFNTDPGGK